MFDSCPTDQVSDQVDRQVKKRSPQARSARGLHENALGLFAVCANLSTKNYLNSALAAGFD